jgi:hypothetical protein
MSDGAEVQGIVIGQSLQLDSANAVAAVTATAIEDAAACGGTYAAAEVNALRTEIVALNARSVLQTAAINALLVELKGNGLIKA